MKILTVALLCALCGAVYAGPKTEMKQVVPVADCPNWTGFYIGGFTGYKYDVTDLNLNLGSGFNQSENTYADKQAIEHHSPASLDASGFELGGLMGYNYQFHNNWIIGLETDAAYLWLGKSADTGIFNGGGASFSEQTSLKTHYLITIGPRIGYAFCKWFPYITGGLAIGDIGLNQTVTIYEEGSEPFLTGKNSQTNFGWMVGAGVQYAITEHWSARMQYQYIDLGSVSVGSTVFGELSQYTANHSASLTEHNISVAIIYQF